MKYLSEYIQNEAKKLYDRETGALPGQVCEQGKGQEGVIEPYDCKSNRDFIPITNIPYRREREDPKPIAFYLPQYHQIKENNEWWGMGFTEWTNVTRAVPQYEGHYQPHLPIDVGFYDLNDVSVMARQAELARMYGVYGFCYYYYWFSGKKLLEKPLENLLAAPHIDFPFCLCWANENWTRRWDGAQDLVLMKQRYGDEDIVSFVADIAPYLNDPRYIRRNGAPLLIIYASVRIPYSREFTGKLRDAFRTFGYEEMWLVAALSYELGNGNPEELGYDAAVEFPLFGLNLKKATKDKNETFKGTLFSYPEIISSREHLRDMSGLRDGFPYYRTALISFDNTARRMENATITVDSSPRLYKQWLDDIIVDTKKRRDADNFIFIHAWNEWAEGSHLEPDRRYGYSYLSATREAVVGSRRNDDAVSVICLMDKSDGLNVNTLNSLLNLTYKNKRLITVFTGEGSGLTLNEKEALDRAFPLGTLSLSIPKGSGSVPLNRALSKADGRYFMIVNNADYFEPNRIETFIESQNRGDSQFVFSKVTEPGGGGAFDTDGYENLSATDLLSAVLKAGIPGGTGNFFFTRVLLEKLGGFLDFKQMYGFDFAVRACLYTDIAYVGGTTLYTTRNGIREEHGETVRIYGEVRARLSKREYLNPLIGKISEAMIKYASYYCAGDYFNSLRYRTDNPVSGKTFTDATGSVDSIYKPEPFVIYVRGWVALKGYDSLNYHIYLRLAGNNGEYWYSLPSTSRGDITPVKNDGTNYSNSGYEAFICIYGLAEGAYGVSLLVVSEEMPGVAGVLSTDEAVIV